MSEIERQELQVDIACVGFGPATGGFLTTLTRAMMNEDGTPALESRVMPGMPLQVMCYERADDISFGVSGVVSRARAIKESFPELDIKQIPMGHEVTEEQVLYLLDPTGASRRSSGIRMMDSMMKVGRGITKLQDDAGQLPYIPEFMAKEDGVMFSLGQFNQWVGSELMGGGLVQIWPGMPVEKPIIEKDAVVGIQLVDQGVNSKGEPDAGFMPGMNVKAGLTVVGDGPVGAVGLRLNEHFGMPEGHSQNDWAVGMKAVIELPESCTLKPGTVLHTLGYPEPEIFGFLYVYPDRTASVGIFVPSWFDSPVRTSYRYLQHWMKHPALWKHLKGGTMRSWGAKSLQEAGRRGEPVLAGDGFARIGEGSGSTNVLTNSGVDEAWYTGVLLANAVIELAKEGKDFSKENLDATYVRMRRNSWLQKELDIAEKARDGFHRGVLTGLMGVGLTGMTKGRINMPGDERTPQQRIPSLEEYYGKLVSKDELENIRMDAEAGSKCMHDALMDRAGWPKIEYDGQLLMSQQDALLIGGKVQANPGFADHIHIVHTELCGSCESKLCVEVCSGQALTRGEDEVPEFDREKCVHCGACIWNCTMTDPDHPERSNIEFRAGSGGLHSGEN